MPANAPFVIPVKPVLDLIGERESRPAARSRTGHRAGLKALSVAAGTLTRPTISSISPRRRLYEPEASDQHPAFAVPDT